MLPSKYDSYNEIIVDDNKIDYVYAWCANNSGKEFGGLPFQKGIISYKAKMADDKLEELINEYVRAKGIRNEKIENFLRKEWKSKEYRTTHNVYEWIEDESVFKIAIFEMGHEHEVTEKDLEFYATTKEGGDVTFGVSYISEPFRKTLERFTESQGSSKPNIDARVKKMCEETFNMTMRVLYYVNHFVEKKEVIRTEKLTKIKTKKKTNKKSYPKRITRTVYSLLDAPKEEIEQEDGEKRGYLRQTYTWVRKGHFRRGKWIPEKVINLLDDEGNPKGGKYKL